jgi:hypothetical protein
MVLTGASPSEGAAIVVRLYDTGHHAYHRWDGREQRAYRAYLESRHLAYVRYAGQRAEQRRAYWRWRHERLEHEGRQLTVKRAGAQRARGSPSLRGLGATALAPIRVPLGVTPALAKPRLPCLPVNT